MLQDFLNRASQEPFSYGRHDCCTVAAEWVMIARGVDILQGQTYENLRVAKQLLRDAGYRSHVDAFAEMLPRKSTLSLVEGDVAVMSGRKLPALGIVMRGGERVWCFGPDGAGSVLLTHAKYGFGVRE